VTTTKIAVMAAEVLLTGTEVSNGASLPVRIDTSPTHNQNWTTFFTNEVPSRWEWPETATSATLTIAGKQNEGEGR